MGRTMGRRAGTFIRCNATGNSDEHLPIGIRCSARAAAELGGALEDKEPQPAVGQGHCARQPGQSRAYDDDVGLQIRHAAKG